MEACRWTFTPVAPAAYISELADDGAPVERLELDYGNIARTKSNPTTANRTTPGVSPQVGFVSGLPLAHTVVAFDTAKPVFAAVASDAGFRYIPAGAGGNVKKATVPWGPDGP